MSFLKIEGNKKLTGEVSISGAKNAALPILAACIMIDGQTELTHVPYLKDIVNMIRMLNALGVRAEYRTPNKVLIWNEKKVRHIAPYDLITAMRASFFVAGPILAKTGLAKVALPGGCAIGSRPVDIHLKGFKDLGAFVGIEHGFVELRAEKLIGSVVNLDFPSVGATENIMMAATLAEGETTINNAAQEPEIEDLGNFLVSAGAKITGLGTSSIKIIGVPKLTGTKYEIIPDRIETGTFIIAGLITKGDIIVNRIVPSHIQSLLDKLTECGADLKLLNTDQKFASIKVTYTKPLQGTEIITEPFPGFPTDMQAQMMSLLTLAKGKSVIKENIFENRFMHVSELMRMGANIKTEHNIAIIEGVDKLSGAEVKMTDLRAGAALVLAGLAAEGYSTIYGLKHLKRGYENLSEKLRNLGAYIVE
jgi:UDP-N-acetylglucosamine 1-carboxyvinyltransferase